MGELCVENGQTILFIGDSITDCGRRGDAAPLGSGYVRFFSELVMAYYPERDIRYINTGIGGNRITNLKARWEEDALAYKPDWLSIKIGINDLHSHLSGNPDSVSRAAIIQDRRSRARCWRYSPGIWKLSTE
jgi:lysophospholipase L1-like esterase